MRQTFLFVVVVVVVVDDDDVVVVAAAAVFQQETDQTSQSVQTCVTDLSYFSSNILTEHLQRLTKHRDRPTLFFSNILTKHLQRLTKHLQSVRPTSLFQQNVHQTPPVCPEL